MSDIYTIHTATDPPEDRGVCAVCGEVVLTPYGKPASPAVYHPPIGKSVGHSRWWHRACHQQYIAWYN